MPIMMEKRMNNVAILMSTYNGEKYISEQINSIFNQTYKDWTLYIRDDGSTDNTLKLLTRYAFKDKRVKILSDINKRLGPKNSFFTLLKKVNAKYYFFADQDDVWNKNKLEIMLRNFNSASSQPQIVYCALQCTDANLNPIDLELNSIVGKIKGKNRLIWNDIPGCTMAFNKELRDISIEKNIFSNEIVMHDWWLALIGEFFGNIKFVNKKLIYYRQHSDNAVGAGEKESIFKKITRKNFIKKYIKKQKIWIRQTYRQNTYFYELYKDILPLRYRRIFQEWITCKNKGFLYRIKVIKKYKTPVPLKTYLYRFYFINQLKI